MQGELLPPFSSPDFGGGGPSRSDGGRGASEASARLIHIPNPLAPELGARIIECDAGLSVSEVIDASDLHLRYSTVLCRNGGLVRRSEWDLIPIAADETLSLITLPDGGGGAGGVASEIIGIIALIVASVFTFGAAAAAAAAIGLSGIGAELFTAAAVFLVNISGQYLISALTPHPKKPQITGPDYALFNQSNSARLTFPIPEIFGKFMVYPQLASVPYSDWNDNRQHLYSLFSLGIGEYEIEQIRIAQTIVYQNGAVTGSYPDLRIQIVNPGDEVTLFPGNVTTSTEVQSIELKGTNEVGAGWFGPFVACAAGTQTSQICIDMALPSGLFHESSSGHIESAEVDFQFQAQAIDDSGTPTGSWFDILNQHWKMSTRDGQYVTRLCDVPKARYQVRGQRTNAKSLDGSTADLLIWTSLRAFLPGSQTYPDVTIIAVRAAPTQGLNSTSASQLNVIATRKLPVYDPGTLTWSDPVATRSIAAAAAYLLRSDNGANLPDSRIDLDILFGSLDTTWSGRGDTFDGVFEIRQSFWESLQTVLKAGRTAPILAGEVISFIRDEPKEIYRTAFSPRNMIAGTFQVDYLMHDSNTPDAVYIQFMDERIWQQNRVFCALPDFAGDPDDPTIPTMQWDGIVNHDQAWREGMHLVASNRYRRQFPSFRTELDGRVCFRGDLVKVSHWLPTWGSSMEVLNAITDPGGDILTLSEPWDAPAGHGSDTFLAVLTTPDGKVYGPVDFNLLDDGAATRQAVIQLTTTFDPDGTYTGQLPHQWPVWSGDGLQEERPQATLGVASQMAVDAIVVRMKPERGMTASVVTVVDDSRVYTADGSGLPSDSPSGAPTENLIITSLKVERVSTYGTSISFTSGAGGQDVSVTVSGAKDAISFEAQWKWNDATDYANPVADLSRIFDFPAEDEDLSLQVRARGRYGWGPWFSASAAAGAGGTGSSGSGSGGGIVGGGGADFWSIIGLAGLQTHCQFCIDAGDSDSYGGSGQTITDLSGNGMDWYFGATSGAEGSDPAFHGTSGGLSVNEYFLFGTAGTAGASGQWLTLAAANPAWVNALHQANGSFTLLALIYFPGHPGGLGATDFAWMSPFQTVDGTLNHEGVSVEIYSEAQDVAGTINYTGFIQANVTLSGGADARQAGYTWYPTSTTPTPAGYYLFGLSLDEVSGNTVCFINGVTATEAGIISGGTDAAAADMTLSTGGANASMYNGSRLVCSAGWDLALTGAQMANVYNQFKQYRADFALP